MKMEVVIKGVGVLNTLQTLSFTHTGRETWSTVATAL